MFKTLWNLLFSQAGQIPSSETVNYDALFTTTLRSYRRKLADNVTKGNKWVSFLKEKGRFGKQSGGINIHVPLMHAQNNTADIYSGYGLLDTTPQDGLTTAFYEWSQLSASITISGKEKKQNKGEAQLINLLKAKTMQAEVSLKELLNNCLLAGRFATVAGSDQVLARIGRLDSGATGPAPIGNLVDVTANRSVSIGNINGGTYSFWRNVSVTAGTASFVGLRSDMNRTFDNCTKGIGGSPDVLLGDQIAWEEYWLALENREQIIVNNKRTLETLGGSDALAFRGATFFWDEAMPSLTTSVYNPVDANGTAPLQHGGSATQSAIYFLNTETWDYVVESDTDMDTTDFLRPENQDASTAQILWMGGTGVNNRRKNGVLHTLSQAIVS